MHRRTVLAGVGIVLSTVVSGCHTAATRDDSSGPGAWSPDVTVTTPEIAPGEETTVTVTAIDVVGVSFSAIPDDVLAFDFDGVDGSPPPKSRYLMHPPVWVWGTRTDIDLTIPVSALDDATSGEYQYQVNVFGDLTAGSDDSSSDPEPVESADDRADGKESVTETATIFITAD